MNNLKSIDKKRNRKRGSYHIFLKYLEDNNINIRYGFNPDKSVYLPMIDNKFPEAKLMEKLVQLQKIDNENKVLSQKFGPISGLVITGGSTIGTTVSLIYKWESSVVVCNVSEA